MKVDDPRPGFYKMRLVRGGPFVAARIWIDDATDPESGEPLDRPAMLRASVDGAERDPFDIWASCAGRPIDSDEYYFMLAMRIWATDHRPDLPDASPHDPVDWNELRIFK